MLDFYKWAAENLLDFSLITFVLVTGIIWLVDAVGDVIKKVKGP